LEPEQNKITLEEKLDRLLVTLDEVKPKIERWRLIEAFTAKKESPS
jgi:hypothetical protein